MNSPAKMKPLHGGNNTYKLTIEEMFKDKAMTFEDIEKLNIDVFANGRGSTKKNKDNGDFQPSDILDMEDNDSDSDEILRRFKSNKPARNKLSPNSMKKKAQQQVSRSFNPTDHYQQSPDKFGLPPSMSTVGQPSNAVNSPLMQKDLGKKYSFNRKPSYGMDSNYGSA